MSAWKLVDLPKWVKKLRASDEVAVEITGNTRLFYDAVVPHARGGGRYQPVRIISQSVKKTDPHDARALSLYLSKGFCRRYG